MALGNLLGCVYRAPIMPDQALTEIDVYSSARSLDDRKRALGTAVSPIIQNFLLRRGAGFELLAHFQVPASNNRGYEPNYDGNFAIN
jgi:hypothetical protein